MCDAILTFMLVFSDGHREPRTKYMDRATASEVVMWTASDDGKLAMLQYDVVEVREMKVSNVKPFKCTEGPK